MIISPSSHSYVQEHHDSMQPPVHSAVISDLPRFKEATHALRVCARRGVVLGHSYRWWWSDDPPVLAIIYDTYDIHAAIWFPPLSLNIYTNPLVFCHTASTDGIPDAQAKFYAVGIILALGYLHKKDVAYRDLKPENCLIDSAGYPKLIDFGFAKTLVGSAKTYTLCGTPEYLAPELVLGRGHNRAVDYWALGILVYEMQAGFSPFSDAQGWWPPC